MRTPTLLALSALLLGAGQLAAQEPAPTQQERDKAALIQMKSDLRNLVTAQEAYYADHSSYASNMDGLRFRATNGVTVRLTATQNNAWAAESRSALLPNVACAIWVNLKEADRPAISLRTKSAEGEPTCDFITPKP